VQHLGSIQESAFNSSVLSILAALTFLFLFFRRHRIKYPVNDGTIIENTAADVLHGSIGLCPFLCLAPAQAHIFTKFIFVEKSLPNKFIVHGYVSSCFPHAMHGNGGSPATGAICGNGGQYSPVNLNEME
jgi:hypothetical protein